MSEFLGKLHEGTVKFPQTHIWMDTCAVEALDYGLERGIVGCTSNPVIIGSVIKEEMPILLGKVKELIEEMPTATEEEITWALIDYIGADRSKKLLPIFEENKGKKGRLSIQVNAKYYRSPEKILEQAIHLNTLGKNMQVKMPASAAGIKAMEEATYHGISINATVSFSVAQAIAVAEAVERGLARRRAEGLPCDEMAPICTIMIGRVGDWMKKDYANRGVEPENPEAIEWAGVAVMKNAYKIFKERGYECRLLTAAYRNPQQWYAFLGADLSETIPYKWHKVFNSDEVADIEIKNYIDEPLEAPYMDWLLTQPEFVKAYDPEGLAVEDFVKYGAFQATLDGFIKGYEELLGIIRDIMIYPEKH
ncbi:MAG: transaldolase family protein [Lachnospiraceae bacterium]|nr:transaldolase family protein [Lachnospiraceae bacterium]